MLLEFVRWLQGFVRFVIIGNSPERFINIVTKSGLSIWSTHRKDGQLYASMYARDYKSIRELARKSRVRLKLKSRHGLPFYIRRHKNRIGVLVGAFVFALVVVVLSSFVWTIDVVGLETVSYSALMNTLRENGLYVGTFKPKASFTVISRDTMLDIEDIGWMSINVLGTHASVEIKEKAKIPQVDDYRVPANVKAKCDGLILSINTMQGEALFEKGSAVVKDQMLVTSVVEDNLGRVKLVRADAQVIAQTTHKKSFSVEKNYPVTNFEEEKLRRQFNVFGLSLPVTFAFADEKDCASLYAQSSVRFFDTTLPVSVTTQRLYEISSDRVKLKKEKASHILLNQAQLYEAFALCDCEVVAHEYEYTENDTHYILNAVYTCKEDIAYQQDIDADNVTINSEIPTRDEDTQ